MTYIIAETGSVSDGSLGAALKLIEHCAKAGADAVKFQAHNGERIKGDPPWFNGDGKWKEPRGDYLKRTSFTLEQWKQMRNACTEAVRKDHDGYFCKGIDLIVSPFSVEAVTLLEELPVDAYKIASGQVTNLPMLEAVAGTGRRVFLSSGMTTWEPVKVARELFGESDVTVMHCVSQYPLAPENVGLECIKEAQALFPWDDIGYSDHTLGFAATLAAVTLGADAIERHVTFDRRMYGTDAANSMTLDEFGQLVREIRALDRMLVTCSKTELASREFMGAMRSAFLEA